MQLSDATHDYACTRCRATDGVCMEALWLARRLAASLTARARDLPEDFEIASTTRFSGCDRDCGVELRLTGRSVCVTPGSAGARVEATAQTGAAEG